MFKIVKLLASTCTILVLVNACVANTAVTSDSYFYNLQESKVILESLIPKKTHKVYKISGIFYLSSDNWIVWINDKAYTSVGQQTDFAIDEVSENSVILSFEDGRTVKLNVDA